MAKICIFITTFGDGGVERMPVNLARGLSALGTEVDSIVKHTRLLIWTGFRRKCM
jgi:hypothetical protein